MQKTKLPLMHFKPGQASYVKDGVKFFIQVQEYGIDYEKRKIAEMIKDLYFCTMDMNSQRINSTFERIYGEPLKIKVKFTSEVLIKLKQIMEKTGKTIEQITRDIRNYLGYPCSFFRIDGSRQIPINSERITKAYELMKQRQSIILVENALYF